MKLLKKLTAVLLVCIMVFSFAGCHKKGEIAVTIKDQKFTSGYYACAFLSAYLEAQQIVDSELTGVTMQDEINYAKQTVEGKKFEDWVKDRTIDILKETAYFKALCQENNIEFSKDDLEAAEYCADALWESFEEIFEPNGVSFETFTQYIADGTDSVEIEYAIQQMFGVTLNDYETLYFEFLYGKDGEKEIPAKEIKAKLYNDFLIANVLNFTASTETTKDDLKATKKQFNKYAKKLEEGELTFEEVYNEYNKIEETEEEEHEDHEDHEELATPADEYASIIGATGTGYDYAYYEDIKKMKVGEIKVIAKPDDQGYLLVVKKDIKADKFYLENMDMTIRHLLKDEEFNKANEAYKDLQVDINKFAVKPFKVKKVKLPTYQ